jgi:intracellular sulfur oxidation DsrE/DsrF family protein
MSQDQKFSDEFLNAFVDDQLAPEEKGRAYLSINNDETLNRQVCELRKMRDLVQLAYKDLPTFAAPGPRAGRLHANVAAGFILALGVALGWVAHNPAPLPTSAPASVPAVVVQPVPTNRIVAKAAMISTPTAAVPAIPADENVLTVAEENNILAVPYQPGPASGDTIKVLIHVNSVVAAHNPGALDEIESLVRYYRDQRQNARVEIVINGEGLNLVRVDTTRFAERIRRMQEEYDNLTFAACQSTIQRLKHEHGITAKLLPGVTVIDSGVAQIMRRQQQGWAYIRA